MMPPNTAEIQTIYYFNFVTLNQTFQPKNYHQEEITAVLENPISRQRRFILANRETMSNNEIAQALGINRRKIYRIIGKRQDKKYIVKNARVQIGRLIIDMETGIYYYNVPQLAKALNINNSNIRDYLLGVLGKRVKKYKRYQFADL